jgi:hypothetical protein
MVSWDHSGQGGSVSRRALLVALGIGVWVLLMLWLASPGYAALEPPFDNACPDPVTDATGAALCERLEAIYDTETQLRVGLVNNGLDVWVRNDSGEPVPVTGGSSGPSEISGTVALSQDDRDRMDLSWWGTWALVGLMFVLIVAPRWFSAFRVTRGG